MRVRAVDVSEHARRRSAPARNATQRRRGRRFAVALVAATASLAALARALAADPPTLLTAGIDAQDRLYATWSVAPGTTFDFVTFATVPDPLPGDPTFFADNNFAGFCSSKSLSATCTATGRVADYPSPRDRRYFVKVSAEVTGTRPGHPDEQARCRPPDRDRAPAAPAAAGRAAATAARDARRRDQAPNAAEDHRLAAEQGRSPASGVQRHLQPVRAADAR